MLILIPMDDDNEHGHHRNNDDNNFNADNNSSDINDKNNMTIIMMITTVNDNDDHDQSHHPHHSLPRKASPGKTGKPCIETNIQAVQLNLCLLAGDVDELMPNLRPNFQQRWQHFQDPQRGVRKSGCWDNESNVKLKHKDLLKPCEYSILIHMKQIIQY